MHEQNAAYLDALSGASAAFRGRLLTYPEDLALQEIRAAIEAAFSGGESSRAILLEAGMAVVDRITTEERRATQHLVD